ncbi:unnamed protein product, partial [Didymodactylos carnosus]
MEQQGKRLAQPMSDQVESDLEDVNNQLSAHNRQQKPSASSATTTASNTINTKKFTQLTDVPFKHTYRIIDNAIAAAERVLAPQDDSEEEDNDLDVLEEERQSTKTTTKKQPQIKRKPSSRTESGKVAKRFCGKELFSGRPTTSPIKPV